MYQTQCHYISEHKEKQHIFKHLLEYSHAELTRTPWQSLFDYRHSQLDNSQSNSTELDPVLVHLLLNTGGGWGSQERLRRIAGFSVWLHVTDACTRNFPPRQDCAWLKRTTGKQTPSRGGWYMSGACTTACMQSHLQAWNLHSCKLTNNTHEHGYMSWHKQTL